MTELQVAGPRRSKRKKTPHFENDTSNFYVQTDEIVGRGVFCRVPFLRASGPTDQAVSDRIETDLPSGRRVCARRPWNELEQMAVLKHFDEHITFEKLPGRDQIVRCKEKEPAISRRTWRNIKDFVRNKILKNKSKCSQKVNSS